MDFKSFKDEYNCSFVISEKDRILHEIAKEYHEKTEAYDRVFCSAINDRGIAIPTCGREMRLISINAKEVLAKLLNEYPALDKKEIRKAISNFRL